MATIGVLTTSFPRFEGDAAGAFVLGLARALAARGHTLEILAPEPDDTLPRPEWPGVRLTWVPYLRPRALQRTFYGAGVPDNLRRDPLAWAGLAPFTVALARAAREAMPRWDTVLSHWALPSALVAGEWRGARPHVAILHSADVHTLLHLPGRRLLAKRIAEGATALVFTTLAHRDRFLALLPARLRADRLGDAHVCPMGVDPFVAPLATRAALRRALGFERFTWLSLGRLVPIKGVDRAIDALAGRHDVELVIAGEGPEQTALAARAERAGVSTRFVGHVSGRAKQELLAACDAFVLPSKVLASGRSEGTPTALLEALGASLPIVATDTGGIGDIVTAGRSALLVPSDDPAALRDALDAVRSDAALRKRLSRAGRTVAKHYTWDAIAPRFEALLTA